MMYNFFQFIRYGAFVLLSGLFFVFFFSSEVQAASLYLSPPTGTYTIGSPFVASVLVDSGTSAINAAEGTISFNTKELQVVTTSQDGSIFNLWTTEPTFSNANGTITFGGGSPKSFSGPAGRVFTVTFRAIAAATSKVNFSAGAILAADGKGTNIIDGMRSGVYTIIPQTTTPAAELYIPPKDTPVVSVISSPTHPNQEEWYADSNPKFVWDLPKDVTAVRLLVDKKRGSVPTKYYSPPISEKTLQDVDDGAWYLHVQFRNASGWGKISHFRFQIDTHNPTRFDVIEEERSDLTDPRARIRFDAEDETSGIDVYIISIDDQESIEWRDDGTHIFETSLLEPGDHRLIITAKDFAGNFLINSIDVVVDPLDSPIFTQYPKELAGGDILSIEGTTYPDATVTLWMQREKDDPLSFVVQSDARGGFRFVSGEKVQNGVYTLWAEVTDARGARSMPSEKIFVVVRAPMYIVIGSLTIGLLAVVIPLIGLLFLLAFLWWYGWHRLMLFRRSLRKEVREAEVALHAAFTTLKGDIQSTIKIIEQAGSRRALTPEEEKIIRRLKSHLEASEKNVEKEIKDIETIHILPQTLSPILKRVVLGAAIFILVLVGVSIISGDIFAYLQSFIVTALENIL